MGFYDVNTCDTTYRCDYRDWSRNGRAARQAQSPHYRCECASLPRVCMSPRRIAPCVLDVNFRLRPSPQWTPETTYRHDYVDWRAVSPVTRPTSFSPRENYTRAAMPHLPAPSRDYVPEVKFCKDTRPWYQKVLDACDGKGPNYPAPRKREVENIAECFLDDAAAARSLRGSRSYVLVGKAHCGDKVVVDVRDDVQQRECRQGVPTTHYHHVHRRSETPVCRHSPTPPREKVHHHDREVTASLPDGSCGTTVRDFCDQMESVDCCPVQCHKVAHSREYDCRGQPLVSTFTTCPDSEAAASLRHCEDRCSQPVDRVFKKELVPLSRAVPCSPTRRDTRVEVMVVPNNKQQGGSCVVTCPAVEQRGREDCHKGSVVLCVQSPPSCAQRTCSPCSLVCLDQSEQYADEGSLYCKNPSAPKKTQCHSPDY